MKIRCKIGLHRWKQVWRADPSAFRKQKVIPIPRGFDIAGLGWPGSWGEFVPVARRCVCCGKRA